MVRVVSLDIQVGSCIYLDVCLFWSIAYALKVESSPFRVIPLLSDSSPCRGNLLFQVQGAHGETAHHRGRFRRKLSCALGFLMYYMY